MSLKACDDDRRLMGRRSLSSYPVSFLPPIHHGGPGVAEEAMDPRRRLVPPLQFLFAPEIFCHAGFEDNISKQPAVQHRKLRACY